MTWYSPGWANQGTQPDPTLTAGWTSQVLTAGAQVQKQGSSTGNLITETGTANPADYGVVYDLESWNESRYLKSLASRPKNDQGEFLNKDGSVSKTQ